MKKKSLIILALTLLVTVSLFAAVKRELDKPVYNSRGKILCNKRELINIQRATRRGIAPRATKECSKYSNYELYNIYNEYALVLAQPDMVKCITDAVFVVMKKTNGSWEFVTFTMGDIDYEIDPDFEKQVPHKLWELENPNY
jgi:hypothetical protein